jgi:shikimate dehydrogenase
MRQMLGVIGDPVAHSLSPFIQNRWLRAHQIDAVYAALEVKTGELEDALGTLLARGAIGLNVTLPHKEAALALAAGASEAAQRLGAANVLVRNGASAWRAENTDAPGFELTLEYGDIDVEGRAVTVLGAGGAARAVVDVLARRGARLTICNRTIERAAKLAESLAPGGRVLPLEEGLKELRNTDLAVNTLSLGHVSGVLDLPVSAGAIFYDISYGRAAQPVLAAARAKGWRTLDGLGMLVAQAGLSFQHWFGVLPDLATAHAEARKLIEATS